MRVAIGHPSIARPAAFPRSSIRRGHLRAHNCQDAPDAAAHVLRAYMSGPLFDDRGPRPIVLTAIGDHIVKVRVLSLECDQITRSGRTGRNGPPQAKT